MNNLLERLHASFFFYILIDVRRFVNFGGYLASAILVSVSMIFGGLRLWVVAGWERVQVVRTLDESQSGELKKPSTWPRAYPSVEWRRRERPVLIVLAMMLATHFVGWLVLRVLLTPWFAALLKVRKCEPYLTQSS